MIKRFNYAQGLSGSLSEQAQGVNKEIERFR